MIAVINVQIKGLKAFKTASNGSPNLRAATPTGRYGLDVVEATQIRCPVKLH